MLVNTASLDGSVAAGGSCRHLAQRSKILAEIDSAADPWSLTQWSLATCLMERVLSQGETNLLPALLQDVIPPAKLHRLRVSKFSTSRAERILPAKKILQVQRLRLNPVPPPRLGRLGGRTGP